MARRVWPVIAIQQEAAPLGEPPRSVHRIGAANRRLTSPTLLRDLDHDVGVGRVLPHHIHGITWIGR
jgi:hypothetical protein